MKELTAVEIAASIAMITIVGIVWCIGTITGSW